MPDPRLIETDPGRLWVRPAHRERLAAAGLDRFDALMGWAGPGKITRAFKTRLTVRMEIAGAALYLKRHACIAEPRSWLDRLLFRPAVTDARREWDNLFRMRAAGIPTAEPAALGEDRATGRSLLLLEEIPDADPADDLIARGFPPDRFGERRALLARIGDLVRRLHAAGFNHQDMYLCHIFVGRGPDRPLTLIDLQRAGFRAGGAGRRERIKDLAQLNYSARPDLLTERDRLRLLTACLGTDRLDAAGKRLLAAVFAKTERIRRRDRRLAERRARIA
jgi:hypothetical protein